MMTEIACPFCGFTAVTEYQIMYHLEELHAESGSTPKGQRLTDADAASEATSATRADAHGDVAHTIYLDCPIDGCGEALIQDEMQSHLDLHAVEDEDSPETAESIKQAPKRLKTESRETRSSTKVEANGKITTSTGHKGSLSPDKGAPKTGASWQQILKMPMPAKKTKAQTTESPSRGPRRLGKAELGPHANENQMPAWLVKLLESDGETRTIIRPGPDGKSQKVEFAPNQARGVVEVLNQLLQLDTTTSHAYLCNPCVMHASKLRREGGFCGYRNIQMLTSFIIGTNSQGYPHFDGKIPSIPHIQAYIEHAWDLGINAQGRHETGGIMGTRKYIGTPEAQAMLLSLDIACDAQALKTENKMRADQRLLSLVETYFATGYQVVDAQAKVKLRQTALPPIYFQHPGHSLTIIGFERRTDSTANLLVFDPMFADSLAIRKWIAQRVVTSHPADPLKAYRRGTKYLGKYKEFEILKLTPPKMVDEHGTTDEEQKNM